MPGNSSPYGLQGLSRTSFICSLVSRPSPLICSPCYIRDLWPIWPWPQVGPVGHWADHCQVPTSLYGPQSPGPLLRVMALSMLLTSSCSNLPPSIGTLGSCSLTHADLFRPEPGSSSSPALPECLTLENPVLGCPRFYSPCFH